MVQTAIRDYIDGNQSYGRELIFVAILAFMMFVGINLGSGVLLSGYHFVDDHEVLNIAKYASRHTFLDTLHWYAIQDFSIRFRPLYNLEIVAQTYLLGVNMNHWIMLVTFEGIISFLLFYHFARQITDTTCLAFLFSVIIHFGTQYTLWYRALNQENLAMILLGISLCLLTRKGLNLGIVTFFIVLSSLQKESFLLLLPIYPILHYFFKSKNNPNLSVKMYILEHYVFVAVLFIVFLIEIYSIIFIVGTNRIGYAGIAVGTPFTEYFNNSFITAEHLVCVIPVTLYIGYLFKKYKKTMHFNAKGSYSLVVCSVYIILSQLILHAKSGMYERYLLPFLVGWAILFILVPDLLHLLNNKKVFWLLCTAMIVVSIGLSFWWAKKQADISEANQMLLHSVENILIKNNQCQNMARIFCRT